MTRVDLFVCHHHRAFCICIRDTRRRILAIRAIIAIKLARVCERNVVIRGLIIHSSVSFVIVPESQSQNDALFEIRERNSATPSKQRRSPRDFDISQIVQLQHVQQKKKRNVRLFRLLIGSC